MSTMRERAAEAIWAKRPDCLGKPWPLQTEKDRRAHNHNPIAAVDLSRDYAKAALEMVGAEDLLAALEGLTERYVDLVNCGDCGFWNPENEPEVAAARAAIARARGMPSPISSPHEAATLPEVSGA